jgi:hypothetical protein
MEFLSLNSVNTTTQITVSTGSNANRLFDRRQSEQFSSSGDNSDTTTTTITIEFTSFQLLDRIVLENINWKSFKAYYNSNSSNLFSITSADTGTAQWTQNSQTNMLMKLESEISCTSISFEITSTMIANEEKKAGQIWALNQIFALDDNPDSKGYKAMIGRKEYSHTMSDGGITTYYINDNFSADISLKYVSQTVYDNLKDLHNLKTSFTFIPFPTATNWEQNFSVARIYEVNWIKDFDFEKYTKNLTTLGHSGTIRLRETPK